jgi:hypothetical protein
VGVDTVKDMTAKFFLSVFDRYKDNYSGFLKITGAFAGATTCAVQLAAILINDKIPKKEKAFLVPQELTDGIINVSSFWLLTSLGQWVATKAHFIPNDLRNPRFQGGLKVILSLIGSIISNNFVTPFLRNRAAAYYQKYKLEKLGINIDYNLAYEMKQSTLDNLSYYNRSVNKTSFFTTPQNRPGSLKI